MYIDGFADKEDIIAQFQVPEGALDNAVILYAKYGGGSYEGAAFVLYSVDGKLYEVNGSHCSCHGLENQWDPEETTLKDLEFRWFKKNDRPYICESDEDVNELKRLVLGEMFEKEVLN